jgi:transposase
VTQILSYYYLKQIQKRFGKCIIFVDKTRPHCSKITKKFLDENKDTIRIEYLPIGSPEFNAVEDAGDKVSITFYLITTPISRISNIQ